MRELEVSEATAVENTILWLEDIISEAPLGSLRGDITATIRVLRELLKDDEESRPLEAMEP